MSMFPTLPTTCCGCGESYNPVTELHMCRGRCEVFAADLASSISFSDAHPKPDHEDYSCPECHNLVPAGKGVCMPCNPAIMSKSPESTITDFALVGRTSDGTPIYKVSVDKLPDDFSHDDILVNDEYGNAEIQSRDGKVKGIIKDAAWYNEMEK